MSPLTEPLSAARFIRGSDYNNVLNRLICAWKAGSRNARARNKARNDLDAALQGNPLLPLWTALAKGSNGLLPSILFAGWHRRQRAREDSHSAALAAPPGLPGTASGA
jgi:hypothetical protein